MVGGRLCGCRRRSVVVVFAARNAVVAANGECEKEESFAIGDRTELVRENVYL